jgi:hypothetical protein
MKFVYILIVLVIAASALGCVDKKQTETATENPVKTSVSPGEAVVPPADTSSVESQTSSNGEDLFGTESNLSSIDTTFDDMNMEISLLDSI